MQTVETARVTFTPAGTMNEFAMDDLAHMTIGTKISGLLVIRKDGQENEYLEGEIEVQDEGILFLEH